MDQAIEAALGPGRNPIVAIAGPSFAGQICSGEATAVTVACHDELVARDVAETFSTPLFNKLSGSLLSGLSRSGTSTLILLNLRSSARCAVLALW